MYELLVYSKKHWMDKLSSSKLEEMLKDPSFKAKYDSRYQIGDIVEVREGGYWSEKHGYNKEAFILVCVQNGEAKDAQYLMKPHTEVVVFGKEASERILKRRRYNIDTTQTGFLLSVDRRVDIQDLSIQSLIDKAV